MVKIIQISSKVFMKYLRINGEFPRSIRRSKSMRHDRINPASLTRNHKARYVEMIERATFLMWKMCVDY